MLGAADARCYAQAASCLQRSDRPWHRKMRRKEPALERAAPAPQRLDTPQWERWKVPLGAGLWVVALAVAAVTFAVDLRPPLAGRLADLHVYATAVSSFVHHRSLYGLHGSLRAGFTYPPFAGIVFLPLGFLPEPAAMIAWSVLTVLGVAAVAWVVARRLPRSFGPVALVWPALVALVLGSKPLQSNLRFGQVSVFLALGVLVDVVVLHGRRGQGVLTGICGAVKLTPLLFVPYLWLIGRRRAAVVAAGAFGLATALGFAVLPQDSVAYWSNYVWHQSAGLPLAEGGNQSIYGLLLRAGVHGAALWAVWVALGAGVAVLGLWRARRAWLAGQPLLGLAIAGCVGILVSPISWTHHQLWILLGAAGVFTASAGLDLLIVAVIVGVMVVGLPGVAALGAPGRWLAANHGVLLAAAVACALPFVKMRGRLDGEASARRGSLRT